MEVSPDKITSPSLWVVKSFLVEHVKRTTDMDVPLAGLKAAVSGVLKRSSRTSQLSDVWKEGASFGERRLRRAPKTRHVELAIRRKLVTGLEPVSRN